MQTPAEKYLVEQICSLLGKGKSTDRQHLEDLILILNIGAGQSLSIEKQVISSGHLCVFDRVDVENCSVTFPAIRHCWTCSVEDMKPAQTGNYSLAFANYVLEHVPDLHKAASEINRVLSPSGVFMATIPNPSAPEFVVSKHTPLWLHRAIRRADAWETHYAYSSISELTNIFRSHNFSLQDVQYWPFVEGYLWRYPIVGQLGRWYDQIVSRLGRRSLMGNVVITLTKAS